MLKAILGKNIRYIRESKGVSQKDMALLAGFTPAYLGYLERGQKNPSVDLVQKIAAALDTEAYKLFLIKSDIPTELTQLIHSIWDLGPEHTEFITTVIKAYVKTIKNR